MSVRVVCFDWGGVIVRICRSWEEGCARAGLDVRGPAPTAEQNQAREAASSRYQLGEIDIDEFCGQLAGATGGGYSPAEVRLIHDAWLIEEYAGVDALVAELNGHASIETGLLSNTSEGHWCMQSPNGDGAPHFPTIGSLTHRVASHLIGELKPHEPIYRAFESMCGYTGDSILFFDDLGENVAGARARGWRAEQIDPLGDTAEQMRRHLKSHGVL